MKQQHKYSDVLRAIAPHLAKHANGQELISSIAAFERVQDPLERRGTEFDVATALYWLALDWHNGQDCPLYAVQCVLGSDPLRFSPGCTKGPEPESSEEDLYQELAWILENKPVSDTFSDPS